MVALGLPERVITRPERTPFPLKLVTEYELPLFARLQASMKVCALWRVRVDQLEPPRKRSSLPRSIDTAQVVRAARIAAVVIAIFQMLGDGPAGEHADKSDSEQEQTPVIDQASQGKDGASPVDLAITSRIRIVKPVVGLLVRGRCRYAPVSRTVREAELGAHIDHIPTTALTHRCK